MSQRKDLIEISGYITKTTDRAILFNDGTVKAWLPRSEIEQTIFRFEEDRLETLTIPEWLAKENEFI
jgi:hypothetical protein